MADFRESVLPVVFNSLFSEKNEARDIQNTVDVIIQNQMLNVQKSGSLQDFISITHSFLSGSKDRVTGLILLNQLVRQCNTEIFQQHSPTWLRLLLQILQGHALPSVYSAACHLTSQVLQFSRHFTDLSRDIVATTIPQLIPVLLGASSEWTGAALRCITVCLQTFPGPMTTFRNKIETLILNELEEHSCPKEAIDCLCHLVRCGGGGGQGNKHTDNWTDLCDKLIGSLHETLSVLYEGLETGPLTERKGPRLGLKSLSLSHQDRLCQCVHRWTVLTSCLQTLLGTEFHAVARIPADVIVKLVCRCLSINRKMLMTRPTTERTSLAVQLPLIHIGALKVLKQLTLTTLLVPYCHVVMGYLSQELLWTHWTEAQGNNKPYGSLRSCIYEVLSVWLKVMDGCSGFVHEEKTVIREILYDVTAGKGTLKIDQTSSTVTDGPPVKKKHKGGNYEVSQGISSQRKIHSDANGKLVHTGLEALNWIITTVGSELERKSIQSIQEFTVKTVLLVQNSIIMPVPYSIPACRKNLYRVLQGLALTPHPTAPPLIQCAVRCFSLGQQDKSFEVSSFCLQALRTCEVLIHPRVPCLNGPIICETLVHLGDSEPSVIRTSGSLSETNRQSTGHSELTPSTSQNGPMEMNSNDLQNENDEPMDSDHVKDPPIVYSPVNDTIVSKHENSVNETLSNIRTMVPAARVEIVDRDSVGTFMIDARTARDSTNMDTARNLAGDNTAAAPDDVVEIHESSGSDSEDQSKKRIRKEQDGYDGPSEPKYTKLEDADDVSGSENIPFCFKEKVNGDENEDSSMITNSEKSPINLDESSSDSSTYNTAKSDVVTPNIDAATKATVADSPKPSTSKAGAVDMTDGDSSSINDAENDLEVSVDADNKENMETEKVRTDNGKENGKDGVGTEEPFVTTDSEGNKEVLTAIRITNLDSDEEENVQKNLQASSDNKDKVPSPDVQAMLSAFVDADPDPE